MTRITNADQVLSLLRAHLERMQRLRRRPAGAAAGETRPLARVQELAGAEGLSESEIGRALISGLLAEEFGPGFAVEPKFQEIVDSVHQAIDRDESGRALLRAAIAKLGGKGR